MLTDIEKFKIGSVYDPEVLGGIQYKNIINKLESFSKFKGSKCENCFNNKICTGCIGSNVLGGGPHSKLFVNVREKESLCYYIYSSLEKYKTSMFISSGIESANYDKTIELIQEQLKYLKEGQISDEELLNSKSAIISSLKSIKDSIGGASDFYFSQTMGKTNSTVEKIIEMIEKITVEDIVDAVKNIELDTIYFLSNNKEA